MSPTAQADQQSPRRKRKIILISILSLVLVLGAGAAIYLGVISQAWNGGTNKFSSAFPDESGKTGSSMDGFNQGLSGNLVNSKGLDNSSVNDKNGNGIPDHLEYGVVTARPSETGSTDILLLGSDSRAGTAEASNVSGQRADSIMLLHISVSGGDPYLISLMRDSWVNIPGYGAAKINAALNYGGVDLQVATIEQLLNVRIDHVAEIDFSGFKSMTDALGGVTVQVPVSFSSNNYTFTAGEQTMSGGEALVFVRERYSFADGDYQRVRNQRAYMNGLLNTIKSQGVFENIGNFKNLIDSITPYVTVDSGLTAATIASLALPYLSSGGPNLQMLTMPNAGPDWSMDGQSIVVLNVDATAELSNALREGTMDSYVSKHGTD